MLPERAGRASVLAALSFHPLSILHSRSPRPVFERRAAPGAVARTDSFAWPPLLARPQRARGGVPAMWDLLEAPEACNAATA